MTPLRDKAIALLKESAALKLRPLAWEEVVDALLAAGMLTDPEECARTYSLISELIATGKDDDAERAYRLAVKAWRRARDVADGKPLAPRDGEARIERAASKFYERLRGVAIKYGAAPAWDDLSGVQRVPWIEDARQALAAADQEDTDA